MKPVEQSQFYDPESGKPSDCLRACLASVFETSIEEIPAFEMLMHRNAVWGLVQEWLFNKGYFLIQTCNAMRGYSIALGYAPRRDNGLAEFHTCVAHDGQIVFDPHPSKAGLEKIETFVTLIPCTADFSQVRALALQNNLMSSPKAGNC